ncbi:uncharacterized protein LOC111702544 isoform X2 [Eurytemora carolleeae]|uniref:uncharacterized protein LOC111702544 isoform X2 n=1 Tax=Eurytemora carolleeae TaxID=1294199 RepID=UPI000C781459|nr:uncharacterized protein LOC111702544 isoform X2 [Eurytemora carolleeae]|eukprot:XP_023330037.1 uncharacterized protein LOC111702544 isoform X2 [Eurytemora affinis]
MGPHIILAKMYESAPLVQFPARHNGGPVDEHFIAPEEVVNKIPVVDILYQDENKTGVMKSSQESQKKIKLKIKPPKKLKPKTKKVINRLNSVAVSSKKKSTKRKKSDF